jgi:hypothetical protein
MEQAQTYTQGEVVDSVLDIRIPVEEVFAS